MARINIEDQFWKDIIEVAARMGDSDRAVGQALKLIQLGQERFKAGRPISVAEFDAKFSRDLIPEFARIDGDRVIVAGAGKHFAWLRKKSEAGKIGGSSKSPKKTKNLKQNRNTPKQNRSKTETEPKLTEASPSLSSSPSCSSSPSISVSNTTRTKAGAFIAGYKHRVFERWKFKPNVEGKDAGICKRVAERLSFEEIELYLDAFFRMPDAELVKKKHAIYLFELKINEIGAFAHTGNFTTNRQAMQADDMASNALLLQQVREGKI